MMSLHELDVVTAAVRCFGYLLPRKQPFTLGSLAGAIRAAYSLEEARTAETVRVLELAPQRIAFFL